MSAVFARNRPSSDSRKLIVAISFKERLAGNPCLLESLESVEELEFRLHPTQNEMGMLFIGRDTRTCQFNGRMDCLNGNLRRWEVLSDQDVHVGNLRKLGRLQHGFLLWLVKNCSPHSVLYYSWLNGFVKQKFRKGRKSIHHKDLELVLICPVIAHYFLKSKGSRSLACPSGLR